MPVSVKKTSFLPPSYNDLSPVPKPSSRDDNSDDNDIRMPGNLVDSAEISAVSDATFDGSDHFQDEEFARTRELSHLYRVTTKQGDGGCSVVYDAWRIADGAHVALKVLALSPTLPPEESERTRQRFFAEAEVLTSFVDDHIVKCLNYGLFNGAPCVVLEFISGKQLDAYIRDYGMLPYEYAIGILRQVLLALEEAHSKGIIHRDLKPANILIIREVEPPVVKLIDFGIASFTDRTQNSLQKTPSGIIRGTPSYMAPELFSGNESASVESDLYAIGLILSECLTGKVAYSAPSLMQVAYKQVNEPLTLPVFIPECLNHIIRKCCEKDRAKRYHSARELIQALDNALPMALAVKEKCEQDYLKSIETVAPDIKPKHASLPVIIAAIACLLAVLAIVIVMLNMPKQTQEQPPMPAQAEVPDANAPAAPAQAEVPDANAPAAPDANAPAAPDANAPAAPEQAAAPTEPAPAAPEQAAAPDANAPAAPEQAAAPAPKPKSDSNTKSKTSKSKTNKDSESKASGSDKGTQTGKKTESTYIPTSMF